MSSSVQLVSVRFGSCRGRSCGRAHFMLSPMAQRRQARNMSRGCCAAPTLADELWVAGADESDLSGHGLAVSPSAADRGSPRPPASRDEELVLYEVSCFLLRGAHTQADHAGMRTRSEAPSLVSKVRQDSGFGLSVARKRMRPHSVTPVGVGLGDGRRARPGGELCKSTGTGRGTCGLS